ncbi:unnamed protein product [Camellia sinensis]
MLHRHHNLHRQIQRSRDSEIQSNCEAPSPPQSARAISISVSSSFSSNDMNLVLSHMRSHGYEAYCIDVEILSRCLEAKLTVCCCFLSRDKEVIYVDIKYMFSDKNTQSIALTTTTYGFSLIEINK